MVHRHNGILFTHKKKEILPFATTWMDPEDLMLSEISQVEKDKYHMISLIVESKKKTKLNEQNSSRPINTEK